MRTTSPPDFATIVQHFFCQWVINQRQLSPRTVAAYRDTFRLLLRHLEKRLNKPAATLLLIDLDSPAILAFLDHLQIERKNSNRTRNARLAAIRCFLNYAGTQDPTALPVIKRVLAIPMKRFDRPALEFLSRKEVQAIIDAPDRSTWSGQRDHVFLALLYNTGARVSELVSLRTANLTLGDTTSVLLEGKGRKQRVIPVWKSTAKSLRQWLKQIPSAPDSPLFPNASGQTLTRSGAAYRLAQAVQTASSTLPSISRHRISPHTFRHTTAMHLLQSGVDLSVIALWLGHENPATTHSYIEADLTMKENALSKAQPVNTRGIRYKPTDKLLRFLEGL